MNINDLQMCYNFTKIDINTIKNLNIFILINYLIIYLSHSDFKINLIALFCYPNYSKFTFISFICCIT